MMLYCIYKKAKNDNSDDDLDLKKQHKQAVIVDDKLLSTAESAKFSGFDEKQVEVEVVVCNKPIN